MESLSSLLRQFDGRGLTIKSLEDKFREIAKAAIYGGHFLVDNELEIRIVEVEFYFHCENDKTSAIHDWAMYHIGKDLDYLPVGSLHPHRSGVDVTFERKGEYRASFLIRKYEIGGQIYDKPSYLGEDLIGHTGCILRDGPHIEWIDDETSDSKDYPLTEHTRKNLSAYSDDGKLIQGEKDKRLWRLGKP